MPTAAGNKPPELWNDTLQSFSSFSIQQILWLAYIVKFVRTKYSPRQTNKQTPWS